MASSKLFHNAAKSSVPDHDPVIGQFSRSSSIWVFIAQLGEHCSANAEATDSNPVEAPKNFFSGYFRNCLICNSLRWSHTHFICIPAVHIISFSIPQQVIASRMEQPHNTTTTASIVFLAMLWLVSLWTRSIMEMSQPEV